MYLYIVSLLINITGREGEVGRRERERGGEDEKEGRVRDKGRGGGEGKEGERQGEGGGDKRKGGWTW